MGTFGPKNFESDSAHDWLDDFLSKLVTEIAKDLKSPSAICDHVLGAKIEVLALILEFRGQPPKPEKVAAWRRTYLRTWEAKIDTYDPNPEYKEERREVIKATFARLAAVSKRFHRQDNSS